MFLLSFPTIFCHSCQLAGFWLTANGMERGLTRHTTDNVRDTLSGFATRKCHEIFKMR